MHSAHDVASPSRTGKRAAGVKATREPSSSWLYVFGGCRENGNVCFSSHSSHVSHGNNPALTSGHTPAAPASASTPSGTQTTSSPKVPRRSASQAFVGSPALPSCVGEGAVTPTCPGCNTGSCSVSFSVQGLKGACPRVLTSSHSALLSPLSGEGPGPARGGGDVK